MPRRLRDRERVSRSLVRQPQARNYSIHGPRTVLGGSRPFRSYWGPFKRKRCLLSCDDLLLGKFLWCKPSCYSMRAFHCNQVLTGVLPYGGSSKSTIIDDIRSGVRPIRPVDSSKNRWLWDPVWDVITNGWSAKPERRCELSVVHHVFSMSSQQEDQDPKPGDLNIQTDDLAIAERSLAQTGQQQRRKILPRIASFFQFLRDLESGIQRRVDEIDKARPSTLYPLPKANGDAASGRSHHVGTGATKVVQYALQNMQPTSRDPKVHAYTRLLKRLRGS